MFIVLFGGPFFLPTLPFAQNARRAMKPIGPSVPLTRPSLVPPSAEQSPPIVRSPPPAASSATGTLARHARLRGAKIYCKLRWLYFGHNQRFSTLFPQEPSLVVVLVRGHLSRGSSR